MVCAIFPGSLRSHPRLQMSPTDPLTLWALTPQSPNISDLGCGAPAGILDIFWSSVTRGWILNLAYANINPGPNPQRLPGE